MKNTSLIAFGITQAVSATLGLLVVFGVSLTAEQMAAIMVAAGVVGGGVAFVLWATTVDRREVVERLIGGRVVAGQANDLVPAGRSVRELGEAPGVEPEHAWTDKPADG